MPDKAPMPLRLLVTGGGTGGHLFPAIAAAQAMADRMPGAETLFIGTRRKMDEETLKRYGFAVRSIHCRGLKGMGMFSRLMTLAILPVGFIEALYHILCFRPHLVLGVGGYVTGPVMLAARICGRPTVIHEQNSIPGMANRQLGKMVRKICLSLPGSKSWFPEGKTVLTGNPVRRGIRELYSKSNKQETESRKMTLVVLGGSQGAHKINKLVVEAMLSLRKMNGMAGVRVIHQTGSIDEEPVRKAYEQAGIVSEVAAFFIDMKYVYQQADLVVSRAGATTLAELAVLGKPAILVPYPYAADNHQEKNGKYYTDGGGTVLMLENELSGRILAGAVAELWNDQKRMQTMGNAMRDLAFPDAAEKIVDVCQEMLEA